MDSADDVVEVGAGARMQDVDEKKEEGKKGGGEVKGSLRGPPNKSYVLALFLR